MDKKLIVGNIGMKFGMSHIEGALDYGAEIAMICDCNEENLRFAVLPPLLSRRRRL